MGISAAGKINLIENCRINNTGAGGAATGGTTNNGGNGGFGISATATNPPPADLIVRNCTVAFTGAGGAGSTATGSGGTGIYQNSVAGSSLMKNCAVIETGGGAGTNAPGFNLGSIGYGIVEDCTVQSTFGDGFLVNGTHQTLRNCTASYCLLNGFNCSNAGVDCVVERCTATNCVDNGFAGTTSSNVVFYLNSGAKNGPNYLNVTTGNGSAAIAAVTASPAYGNNLSA